MLIRATVVEGPDRHGILVHSPRVRRLRTGRAAGQDRGVDVGRDDEGRPGGSRALPAMPPEDDPGHQAVLAGRDAAAAEEPDAPIGGRGVLRGALAGNALELLALAVLVLAPPVLGWTGLLAALVLVAASRFWGARAKAVAVLGAVVAAVLFGVVVAWLRATQVSEAESSRARMSTAGRALADTFGALPTGIGWFAAAYLGYLLVRTLAEEAVPD